MCLVDVRGTGFRPASLLSWRWGGRSLMMVCLDGLLVDGPVSELWCCVRLVVFLAS